MHLPKLDQPQDVGCTAPGRAFERSAVSTTAAMRRGMRRGSVEVQDLSTHGAKILTLDPLEAGDQVWLTFPKLEALQVTIMWANGFEAGCKFERPLHPAVLQLILQHSGRSWS